MSILSSLASCAATRRLQDCDSRPPVLVRQRPGLPGRRLSARPDARVRQLRSADTRTLVVSRTRSSFGDRTFAAAGPQVWNSRSPNLRWAVIRPVQTVTEDIFIRTVFLTPPNRNILTYLLTYLLTYMVQVCE